MILPLKKAPNRLTSLFRRQRPDHDGIDIVGKLSPMIETDYVEAQATVNMEIIQSRIVNNKNDRTSEWGNYVIGIDSEGNEHIYAHLRSRNVSRGTFCKAGETIGVIGNTGNSQGIHLHYGIRKNGVYKDPCLFLGIKNANIGDVYYNTESEGENDMKKVRLHRITNEKFDGTSVEQMEKIISGEYLIINIDNSVVLMNTISALDALTENIRKLANESLPNDIIGV